MQDSSQTAQINQAKREGKMVSIGIQEVSRYHCYSLKYDPAGI